jgi:hypothetical protein
MNTTKAAINHIQKIKENENFFLWVHYIDPHMPYYPSEDIAQNFDPNYIGPYKNHFGGKPGSEGEDVYPEELGKEQVVFHNQIKPETNDHIRKLCLRNMIHLCLPS